jgi:ribosomal protein L29
MSSIFHELTDEEMTKQMEDSRSELRELRFTYAMSRSLTDPSRVGKLKRNIAKMMTITRERQLGKAVIKAKVERKTKAKKKKKDEAKA